MALGEHLQKKLRKLYEPSSMVNIKYKGNDVAFKTDSSGNATVLFIGRKGDNGIIRGERYVRTLKRDSSGKVIKDHWDLKGKAD